MNLRTITVASTSRSGAKTIQSEASTWGQLKDALSHDFGDVHNMRAVIRESRTDLVSDDAVLPDGAFTVLLTPKQIKAGAKDVDVIRVLEAVKELFSNGLDEIMDEVSVDGGEFSMPEVTKKVKNVGVSSTLQRELEDLKNGRI